MKFNLGLLLWAIVLNVFLINMHPVFGSIVTALSIGIGLFAHYEMKHNKRKEELMSDIKNSKMFIDSCEEHIRSTKAICPKFTDKDFGYELRIIEEEKKKIEECERELAEMR